MGDTHKGKCFCGAVEIEVSGEPMGMGYCHCQSCRAAASTLVHTWTAWPVDAVKVTRGADNTAMYSKTPNSERHFCTSCGGNIMTVHPSMGMIDVCAGTIPGFKFAPGLHVNYAETVHPMQDGLPKFKDFPAEMGGSGDTLPE